MFLLPIQLPFVGYKLTTVFHRAEMGEHEMQNYAQVAQEVLEIIFQKSPFWLKVTLVLGLKPQLIPHGAEYCSEHG